jgi:tellurite resistance protein TerC
MTTRKAILWSLFWVVCALCYSLWLHVQFGMEYSLPFLTCYTVEKLLSVDNLFMFYVIFAYFKTDIEQQRKLLNIGIGTSAILRACLIFPGVYLVNKFSFTIYIFALFLLYASYKIFSGAGSNDEDNNQPPVVITHLKKWFSSSVLVIAAIEITDLLFALDSIPAGFGITTNAQVLFAANIFAILGLRSMYFVLLNAIKQFVYLEFAVGIILSIVGIKMLISSWFVIPELALLISIATIIATAVFASKLHNKGKECIS